MAVTNDAPQAQGLVQIVMPGHTDRERITRAETEIESMQANIQEIRSDVKLLISKFDELTGGKKMLIAITSVVGGIVTVALSLISGVLHWGHS